MHHNIAGFSKKIMISKEKKAVEEVHKNTPNLVLQSDRSKRKSGASTVMAWKNSFMGGQITCKISLKKNKDIFNAKL